MSFEKPDLEQAMSAKKVLALAATDLPEVKWPTTEKEWQEAFEKMHINNTPIITHFQAECAANLVVRLLALIDHDMDH